MGRYYTGDIEGKFWFAVQPSDDADNFGVEGTQPNCLEYYFDKTNLPDIKKGIEKCEKKLGEYKSKMDKYFTKHNCYNDMELAKELNVSEEKVGELLKYYARLEFGKEILTCVEKNSECSFQAEL
jgi:hypothetical protein